MPRVPLVDRFVLSLFGLARNLFLLQTLAFGSGALASMALSASPWARRGLLVPTAALVAWSVFLKPSGQAARQFGRER